MSFRESLCKSLEADVIRQIRDEYDVNAPDWDENDFIGLTYEVERILVDYEFNRKQTLDLINLMFEDYVDDVSIESIETNFSDFVRYYISGYVAQHIAPMVNVKVS